MGERLLILGVIVASAAIVGAIVNALLRRRHHIGMIDPADIDAGSRVVVFTSPYCHGCREWLTALEGDEVPTTAISVAERPDLAARYRISSTPRIVVVDGSGLALREFHHFEPRRSDLDQIIRLSRD